MGISQAPFQLEGRRVVLLADGDFTTFGAKTAVCYLRYRMADCVAVVDASSPHATVHEAVGFGGRVPIVKSIVGRIKISLPPHIEEDDLHSVGLAGLIAALKKYDPSQQKSFGSYAAMRIRGAVPA